MENLLLSFNVVTPLLIYMLLGYGLRAMGIISEKGFRETSQILFYACTPALCLTNLCEADLGAVTSDPFALYLGAGVVIVFLVTLLLVPRFSKENPRRGVLVQGIFRSNDGVFGIAVGLALLDKADMSLMLVCIAITVPIFNVLAALEMEIFRGGKPDLGRVCKRLLTNPMIIGCSLGILLNLLRIELPPVLQKPLSALSDACAPIGFLALGGVLSFGSIKKNRTALLWTVLLRLVIIPVTVLSVLIALGYRGAHLLVAMIIFGAPSAMSVFPMASSMEGDAELASEIVAITSTVSILTVFLFIFVLKQSGMA